MGRYSVGAKVRDRDGDLCEIIGKPEKGWRDCRVMGGKHDGTTYWAPKRELEPANKNISPEIGVSAFPTPAVGAWMPKVGDRVRNLSETGYDSFPVGGTGRVVEPLGRGGVWASSDIDGWNGYFFFSELEPAPLTIEAGRFYRTRDGRKVGPLRQSGSSVESRFWLAPDIDGAWHKDGVFWPVGHIGHTPTNAGYDLVAEWVESAPEVAVAEATATLKFKVGDKVDLYRDGKPVEAWRNMTITGTDGEFFPYSTDVGLHCYERELVLVEPAAPPAKFKVGDRVVIVSSPYLSDDAVAGRSGTITSKSQADHRGDWEVKLRDRWHLSFREAELALLTDELPIGSTVTITATGRLSAINENGHYQVTFPGLTAGRNSFALPADYVSLAN